MVNKREWCRQVAAELGFAFTDEPQKHWHLEKNTPFKCWLLRLDTKGKIVRLPFVTLKDCETFLLLKLKQRLGR